MRPALLLVLSTLLLAGCGDDAPAGPTAPVVPSFRQPPDKPAGPATPAVAGTRSSFRTRPVVNGLDVPVQIISRPGDPRLFVVEQGGLIRVVDDGKLSKLPYLDLSRKVRAGGELGLLSAVFSPDGSSVTALWTDKKMDTRVTRYSASQVRAEFDAEEELLFVDQPEDYENHKGGTLLLAPGGGLLLSLGDGGSAFDPGNRSQDPRSKLGKILRYDGQGWSIVMRGLRNPYRMSLDDATGRLWIGDVGQDRIEEIDAVRLPGPGEEALNLGWAAYEGTRPLGRKPLRGEPGKLVWPVAEYEHGTARDEGCSVTGGLVHRGRGLPRLKGRYVFADFCTGQLWTADARGAEDRAALDLRRERAKLAQVTSFAVGPRGELLASTADGRIHALISD